MKPLRRAIAEGTADRVLQNSRFSGDKVRLRT